MGFICPTALEPVQLQAVCVRRWVRSRISNKLFPRRGVRRGPEIQTMLTIP
jgi:hypothetical protein